MFVVSFKIDIELHISFIFIVSDARLALLNFVLHNELNKKYKITMNEK